MQESIEEKKVVLKWMEEKEIDDVDEVGKVIAEYYSNHDNIVEMAENSEDPDEIL